jgi:hypothetical protein
MADNPAAAAVAEIEKRAAIAYTSPARLAEFGADIPLLLAAVNAALACHQRTDLYGNAATGDEPDACPHDPDDALHFEGDCEWLCEGKPEGAACSSCTDEDSVPVEWPCPEYAAILAALTGKGNDGGS